MDDDAQFLLPLRRMKRYLYVANKTCGYIPFCPDDIHNTEFVYPDALFYHPECSGFAITATLILDLILFLLITTSNLLIIVTIRRSRALRNCQGTLKVNLAVYDLIMGAMVIPGCAYNKIRLLLVPLNRSYITTLFELDDDISNKIFGFALTMSVSGSLMSLFLLSMERCRAVTRPLAYLNTDCRRRSKIAVTIVACVVFFLSIVPFCDPIHFSYTVDYMTMAFTLEIKRGQGTGNIYHGLFFMLIVFVLPYLAVVTVTIVTWWAVLRDNFRSKRVILPQTNSTQQNQCSSIPGGNSRYCAGEPPGVDTIEGEIEAPVHYNPRGKLSLSLKIKSFFPKGRNDDMRQVTTTVSIIIATFSACVLPFMVVQAMNLLGTSGYNYEGDSDSNSTTSHVCHPELYMAFLYLMFMNSFCNFVIYNLRNDTFRGEFLRLIRGGQARAPTQAMTTRRKDLPITNTSSDTRVCSVVESSPASVCDVASADAPATVERNFELCQAVTERMAQ